MELYMGGVVSMHMFIQDVVIKECFVLAEERKEKCVFSRCF